METQTFGSARKRARLIVLGAVLALFSFALCGGLHAVVLENKVDKYALLIVGANDTNATLHRNLDPVDVNGAEVSLSRIYATLKECGFSDANMFILYAERGQQPDWSEKTNAKYFKMIQQNHFSGKYDNEANKDNINAIMTALKGKIDDNDIFVFYIVTHGSPNGSVQLARRGAWSSQEIQNTLGGLNSKTNIFLFDTCFSGSILKNTTFDNAVCVSATSAQTPAWVDRNFSNSAKFIECKANKKFDADKDGTVDCEEAFNETKSLAEKYDKPWREYIKTKYKPNRPMPPGIVDSASIIPEIDTGKDYVEANLFEEPASKSKKPAQPKAPKDPGETAFQKAKKLDENKEFAKAIAAYKDVEALAEKSKFSQEAKNRIEELLKDEKIAKDCELYQKEEQAKSDLDMAKSYFLASVYEKCIEYCRKVIAEHPGTPHEEEAKKLLKEAQQHG